MSPGLTPSTLKVIVTPLAISASVKPGTETSASARTTADDSSFSGTVSALIACSYASVFTTSDTVSNTTEYSASPDVLVASFILLLRVSVVGEPAANTVLVPITITISAASNPAIFFFISPFTSFP